MAFATGDKVRVTEDKEALRRVDIYPNYCELAGSTGVIEVVDMNRSRNGISTPFRVLTKCSMTDIEHHLWLGEAHLTRLPKYSVGDRVRITDDMSLLRKVDITNDPFRSNDRVHRIVELGDGNSRYDYLLDNSWWVNDEQIVELVTEAGESGMTEAAAQQDLKDFREKVISAAKYLKVYVEDNERICEEGFREHLRAIGIEDEIYPAGEPPRGSIVRDRHSSVVYVRQWGCTRNGRENWERSGQEGRVRWSDIKDDVVVVLDTGGKSYVND